VRDEIDDLLGIDTNDPVQWLALELVESDDQLLRKLVAYRHAKGLTQSEVGQRMGVTQPAVAAFERVDTDPKLSTIRRYALAVGVLIRHVVSDHFVAASTLVSNSSPPTTGGPFQRARVRASGSSKLSLT